MIYTYFQMIWGFYTLTAVDPEWLDLKLTAINKLQIVWESITTQLKIQDNETESNMQPHRDSWNLNHGAHLCCLIIRPQYFHFTAPIGFVSY